MKKVISLKRTKRVLLTVAIIIAMLLMAAAAYAAIRHYATATENTKPYYNGDDGSVSNSEKGKIDAPEKTAYSSPTENTKPYCNGDNGSITNAENGEIDAPEKTAYSSPIENTKLYYYRGDGKKSEIDAPEKAAYELAVLFMEDLQVEDKARTFRITEYKDLKVKVIPTTQMNEETAAIYLLREEEVSNTTWIVEISVTYKYEGIISPIGPSNNQWIDLLYQGSSIDFLMTQEGNSFTLKSRYR